MGLFLDGVGFFSDSDSMDIKHEYTLMISCGVDDDTAVAAIKKFFIGGNDELDEDYCTIWYALAVLQYKYGRVTEEVKKNALYCIEQGYTLEEDCWDSKSDFKKRKEKLYNLRDNLINGPQLPFKTPKKRIQKQVGNIGDILCYKLVNCRSYYPNFNKSCYYGKYMLMKVVKIHYVGSSACMPELPSEAWTDVAIYNWMGDEIPNISIIDSLDFIRNETVGDEFSLQYTYAPVNFAKIHRSKYLFNLGSLGDTQIKKTDEEYSKWDELASHLKEESVYPTVEKRGMLYCVDMLLCLEDLFTLSKHTWDNKSIIPNLRKSLGVPEDKNEPDLKYADLSLAKK